VLREEYAASTDQLLIGGAVALVVMIALLAIVWIRGARTIDEKPELPPSIDDLDEGTFPVPPLPGQTFDYTPRVRKPVPAAATSRAEGETPDTESPEVSDG
jgi:hypothetical protein